MAIKQHHLAGFLSEMSVEEKLDFRWFLRPINKTFPEVFVYDSEVLVGNGIYLLALQIEHAPDIIIILGLPHCNDIEPGVGLKSRLIHAKWRAAIRIVDIEMREGAQFFLREGVVEIVFLDPAILRNERNEVGILDVSNVFKGTLEEQVLIKIIEVAPLAIIGSPHRRNDGFRMRVYRNLFGIYKTKMFRATAIKNS